MSLILSRRAFLGASVVSLAASRALRGDEAADATATKLIDDPTFEPNTLFLTWQRDPTTTMTVQWIGTRGETPNTNIYYTSGITAAATAVVASVAAPISAGVIKSGSAVSAAAVAAWNSQETSSSPFGQSDLKVFRAELTKLTPGTNYQFRIGKHSPIYRFRTMPAKATDAISFISGGDCGVNAHAIANNIQAARQDPMFAVIGGDLGYDNGTAIDTSLAFVRNYSKHMIGRDGRLIPMVTCIGNHEVEGGYAKPRGKAPFYYNLFDGLFPETGYNTLDFGDYLSLVLLDTGHTSPIEGAQTDWLEKTLKARVDHPHVMVVNHVPAYPSFRNPEAVPSKDPKAIAHGTGEGNRKHWVPLFEKYRVPVVLEHHDHTFKRTKPLIDGLANERGVLYLGDGSWGRIRSPNAAEKLSYLAVTSRDYHLSLHRLQGAERFHVALNESGKIMDTCRSGQRASS